MGSANPGPALPQNIVILSSLDTKAGQADYLRDQIEEQGFETDLIDIGYGGPAQTEATITANDVAVAAGTDAEGIWALEDTGNASSLMMTGATIHVHRLLAEGRCHGVISFGGASNTTVAAGVMHTLPIGVPKVILSSSAAMPAYSARYFGSKDITIMNAMVDFSGLNDLTRSFLSMGAAAVCGMAARGTGPVDPGAGSRQVAVTGFRFSDACSREVARQLEGLGYTPIPFHAQGVGENAFEDMVGQELFVGVVDIVPAGLSEQLLGGNRAARPDRLEAAGRVQIPQVISTSGFDMISCGPLSRRDSGDRLWESRGLAQRKYTVPDQFRVQARTSSAEVAEIAHLVADKLNRISSPATVMVPVLGWSSLSIEGADLHDPNADSVFVPTLRDALEVDIPVVEVEAELNSDEFATALVDTFHGMMGTAKADAAAVDATVARQSS